MVISKPLVISEIIHVALVTEIPTPIINLLNKIQTDFLWKGKIQKLSIVLYVTNTKIVDSKMLMIFQKLSVYNALG